MKITSRYNLYYTSIAKPQKCSFSQVWKKIPDLKYLLLRIFVIKQSSTFLQFDVKKKILILQPFSSLLAQRSLEKVKGVASSSSSSHISADDDFYGVIQVKYGFQNSLRFFFSAVHDLIHEVLKYDHMKILHIWI